MKSLLVKINNKLNAHGGFLKSVSVLVGGTAFAQIIGLLCLPILTRLYSPEDYSILGIYVAIVSIFAVIACFRFEIAIPISEKDEEAKSLFVLSLLSNIFLVIFLYFILWLSYPILQNFHIIRQLTIWIWLIPLGVFLSGLYSALQYWSTRRKRFKEIAQTRMTQAILGNGTSLIIGGSTGGFWGLILGQLLNFSGGLLKLSNSTYNDLKKIKKTSSLKKTLYKYSDYPKYSTFEALANVSAVHLPLIIIASFVAGPEVGYLMLAMKILGIPMALIGRAMSQVYLSHAPEFYKREQLYSYTIKILKQIFKIIVIPFLLLALLSPHIFDLVFGEGWSGLGGYILIMIPWYFMQILSSPISMALHIIGFQKVALILQIFGFILRVGGLLVLAIIGNSFIVEYYILSGFLFYFIYMGVIVGTIRQKGIT
ncbi:oligosaccharide flippase family protein [Acinetobacter haemolyticus]|uniref:lipopolysaccharide biosynthesis protein n=1 Tax=Acinetobacter haemolyticus TaxID=29430 RepID=UPI0021D2B35C|nr:oligosaccharide flippase family protein [Acinetobacter haemolyticus]MCU4387263.1 oligosaccharide flippase family protein [Acinetobacter haemolyticus]